MRVRRKVLSLWRYKGVIIEWQFITKKTSKVLLVSGTRAQVISQLWHARSSTPRRKWFRKWYHWECRFRRTTPKTSQCPEIGERRSFWKERRGRCSSCAWSSGKPENHRQENKINFGHCHWRRSKHQASITQNHQYSCKLQFLLIFYVSD